MARPVDEARGLLTSRTEVRDVPTPVVASHSLGGWKRTQHRAGSDTDSEPTLSEHRARG